LAISRSIVTFPLAITLNLLLPRVKTSELKVCLEWMVSKHELVEDNSLPRPPGIKRLRRLSNGLRFAAFLWISSFRFEQSGEASFNLSYNCQQRVDRVAGGGSTELTT